MKKKTKKILAFGLVVLIIIGILVIPRLNKIQEPLAIGDLDTQIGQCAGGWTSFSIDQVTVNSDRSRIRVFGVAKGSECLNIRLTTSQLNSELNDQGLRATQDIIGSIRLKEYTKTFPIDKTGYNFYNVYNRNIGFELPFTCTINKCKSEVSDNTVGTFRSGALKTDCNCIYFGLSGISGSFSSARSYGNFKVDFTLDGQTTTLSREQQSINIGNHHIEWSGNLMNLDEIYPPQYDARLISSKWTLVQDGAEGKVNNLLENFAECVTGNPINIIEDPLGMTGFIVDIFLAESRFTDCKNSYTIAFNNIVASKLEEYKANMLNLIYDADTDNNNLYVSLKASPFPSFILDLDATDVGIVALEGDPEITTCIPTQSDLRSGQNEIVQFSVRNNANVNNVEFYPSITCNRGINGFSSNFYINGLQTKTLNAEIHPSNPNQEDLSFGCNLKVTDLKSGKYDTCSFSGSIKYESGIICEPNSLSCDSEMENILKCTSDGSNLVQFQTCQYGCVLTSQGAECRGEPEPIPSGSCKSCDDYALSTMLGWIWKSKSCDPKGWTLSWSFFFLKPPQGTTACLLSFIKLILVPIVFIFGTLFLNDFFETKIRSLKGKKKKIIAIRLILSIFLAGLIAYLVYIAFIVGLIIFIIVLILKIVLNIFLK